jgi:hypothetical protein
MALNGHFFHDKPASHRIWKHTIIARWLANPNRGHSRFPHDFRSLYEYLSHYQSEDSHAHQMIMQVFSSYMLIIDPRMVIII